MPETQPSRHYFNSTFCLHDRMIMMIMVIVLLTENMGENIIPANLCRTEVTKDLFRCFFYGLSSSRNMKFHGFQTTADAMEQLKFWNFV